MQTVLALIVLFCNALTCAQLLLYRREGARYRPLVSGAAWLLIISTGANTIQMLIGAYPPDDIHLGGAGIALVLCILTINADGNVAAIIRTGNDSKNYSARR